VPGALWSTINELYLYSYRYPRPAKSWLLALYGLQPSATGGAGVQPDANSFGVWVRAALR
jgi:hypothetical protein